MLKTVNVVEYYSNTIQAVTSFNDDAAGNWEAEFLFTTIAKENDFSDEEIEVGIEEGYVEKENYQLFIVHNTP
jgi:hypothetical protein